MNRGKRAVSILCLTSFTEEGIKHKRGTGYFSGKVVFIARVFITFRETLTTRTTAKIKHKMEIKFFEIFSRKQNFCLENKIFRNGATTKYNEYKFDGRYKNCCSMPFYAISFYPLLFYEPLISARMHNLERDKQSQQTFGSANEKENRTRAPRKNFASDLFEISESFMIGSLLSLDQ